MSVSVKIVSHKDDVMRECDQKIGAALEAIAQTASSYAKIACPVDTGRLRNSITGVAMKQDGMTQTPSGGAPAEAGDSSVRGEPPVNSVAIGTNVRYAERIELGSSTQAPNGYLGVALSEHMGEYKKLLESMLNS